MGGGSKGQVGSRNSEVDGDNRYLWRMNRRKLEAEAIRDSVLAAAGKLDLTMGGPSFQDFKVEKPEHSPHYEYHLHDPDDPKSHRRSVYRFVVRSKQQPFLAALDLPGRLRIVPSGVPVAALGAALIGRDVAEGRWR